MCAPLPFQIIELLPNDRATVKLGEVTEEVSVDMIEEPRLGDFLILHGRVALTKIEPDEAFDLLEQLGVSAPIDSHLGAAAS